MKNNFKLSEEFSKKMDKEDKLKDVRDRFYLKENEIYMDGNSLGLMSKDSEECLLRVMNEWKNLGINGWMNAENPWFYYRETLAKMQAPLVGAEENEIIIHSSTTLNLHCLVSTFFKPDGKKNKILVDDLNFPSDRYAIESQLKLKNLTKEDNLIVIESKDGRRVDEKDVVKNMTDEVALILLPSVLYRSGQLLDIKYLTKEAHKRDIIIGFDCCHSAGAVEHHLSEWGVDFAFWCNYKYFNNGPGGVASLYVNKRHLHKGPGLSGWFGYKKDKQFDLSNEFSPSLDAGAWQVGSPHIFSMAPLEGSLKIFNEVGIKNVREKSLKLTNYMMYLIDNKLSKYGFFIGNPRKDNKRGGHVSLEHDEAVRINEAMKDRGIIPDFRYPNVIRLAPIALYTSFNEVWKVIDIIKEIMETKEYEKYSNKRGVVA